MKNQEKQREEWVCDQCPKIFSSKSSLTRHHKNIHPERTFVGNNLFYIMQDYFECFSCHAKFRRKDNLQRHIHCKHDFFPEAEKFLECFHCSKKFTKKYSIARHIYSVHLLNKENRGKELRCLKCENSYSKASIVRQHYQEVHGIKMEYEELRFASLEKFESWKTNMQRDTVTQFRTRNAWKNSELAMRRFACHRSGMYENRFKGKVRMRRLKTNGTKKLQGFCPAEIGVKIQNGMYYVTFQRTHVGHSISAREELRFMNLDKEQRLNIVARLRDGVPVVEILKQQNLSNKLDEKLNRLSILSYDDIKNVASSYDVPISYPLAFNNDKNNIDKLIAQKQDSVLYCKMQGQEDTRYRLFDREDFVIVLMDRIQKENLLRYGHKVVAFDGTHASNSYDFVLHALFVLDVNYVKTPAAFVLSNRDDRTVIDVFLDCLKSSVGTLEPRTLICDMPSPYYLSWVSYMKPPQFYLHCSWHVKLIWRQNLNKIIEKERRDEICRRLYDLAHELDEVVFETKLNDFVSSEDDDLRNFLDYFREFFYDTPKQWAYCYRRLAGVNTNLHVNSFFFALRRNLAGGKKFKTLFEGLKYVLEYLVVKDSDNLRKDLRGTRLRKLVNLRQNHQIAAGHCRERMIPVERVDSQTWIISSAFDNAAINFVVEKTEKKECSLYGNADCHLWCEECKICFHDYKCSCVESAIHANMCMHIHTLGIHLQTSLQSEEIVIECYDRIDESVNELYGVKI